MTLFMTSWGGKKSSRNWGRIRATTLASQGNPFLILQGGDTDQSLALPRAPHPRGGPQAKKGSWSNKQKWCGAVALWGN